MAAAAGYKRSCDPQSEASFLKKRRSDVAAGSSIVTAEEAWQVKHDMQVGQDLWEQSHAKECKFLEEKTKRRLAQAVAENAVAWESLDEQKQQWCIECWQKEEKQIPGWIQEEPWSFAFATNAAERGRVPCLAPPRCGQTGQRQDPEPARCEDGHQSCGV